ncbi:MAG: hypothetical protein OXP66_06430, partial [Candidatus Tectomicrobia bacterium]|nr:hypothetical protein [Candidatus Tectomicrobia bacterium]
RYRAEADQHSPNHFNLAFAPKPAYLRYLYLYKHGSVNIPFGPARCTPFFPAAATDEAAMCYNGACHRWFSPRFIPSLIAERQAYRQLKPGSARVFVRSAHGACGSRWRRALCFSQCIRMEDDLWFNWY